MSRRNFSVWHDKHEQWDPINIDEPDLRCQAESFVAAAERLADDSDSNYGEFIVRDDEADAYRQIELTRAWQVKIDRPTSIKMLSEP